MTDQQIKYWQMKSTAALNESSQAKNYAETDLKRVQVEEARKEIDKILAEVERIQQETRLTKAEADYKAHTAVARELRTWFDFIADPTGFVGRLLPSIGKAASSAASSLIAS